MKRLMNRLLTIFILSLIPWGSAIAHPIGGDGAEAHSDDRSVLISTATSTETESEEKASASSKEAPKGSTLPIIPYDGIRVTVLGYHDFSATKKATEMRLPTEKFRKQMQAIKDLGLKVITMEDFIAWKRGDKKVADKSVLITIDDGWKSVYTDAFPILKEFGYPFTVFLYTNYVDGGGAALTTPMIQEMQQHGCFIGSHSISHPYPAKIRAERKKGEVSFATYLRQEMGGSKKLLETQFKQKVTSYAYPGGYVADEMLTIASELNYECLFTVLPGKVISTSINSKLSRYVILGTHDYIFRHATSFEATSTSSASQGAIVQSTPHPVTPLPGSVADQRMPIISADLSKVENLDPASIIMRVAGFGKVAALYHAENQSVSWQVNRRLRSRTCEASVQWKLLKASKYQKPMTWTFQVNREASYQPRAGGQESGVGSQ